MTGQSRPGNALDPEDVIAVASVLSLGDEAFIVGGQASNFWAEKYLVRAPELGRYTPFTSVDIDYFGYRSAARKLAEALGGTVRFPTPDDVTPNSAVVEATVHGKPIIVDFIGDVLGVRPRDLRAVELAVPARTTDGEKILTIPVMHPVACLKSRIANVLSPATRRRDDTARRQLQAAPIIVREYLLEMLETGYWKEAQVCIRELFQYVRSDPYGKVADLELNIDPLIIIRVLKEDPRLDPRYRALSMGGIISAVEKRRSKRVSADVPPRTVADRH